MLKGPFTVWWRDMIVLRRSFFSELAAVVASPLTFYLAFGFGLKGFIANVDGVPYILFMAPGLITMTAVSAAFSESAWSLWFHRRVQHTIEAYRVTPITVYDIVIGKIISGVTHGTVKGAAVAAIIMMLTTLHLQLASLLAYLPYLLLGSMIFSCVGTICGTVLNKPETIGRVEAVVIMPLIFMSGVFFPVSSYPAAMLPFVRLLPTTAIFEGGRYALLDGTLNAGYVANLAISAVAAFAGAVWVFNRRIEE